jgi:ketosteroid isomerase-like protein
VSSKADIQEVKVIGEWAFMWQKLFVAATPTDGNETIRREGYTLTIFKKERSRWLLARDANMLAIVPNASE